MLQLSSYIRVLSFLVRCFIRLRTIGEIMFLWSSLDDLGAQLTIGYKKSKPQLPKEDFELLPIADDMRVHCSVLRNTTWYDSATSIYLTPDFPSFPSIPSLPFNSLPSLPFTWEECSENPVCVLFNDLFKFYFMLNWLDVSFYSSITVNACDAYTWNDSTYISSGIYTHVFQDSSSNGCDSLATLLLTINSSSWKRIYIIQMI